MITDAFLATLGVIGALVLFFIAFVIVSAAVYAIITVIAWIRKMSK